MGMAKFSHIETSGQGHIWWKDGKNWAEFRVIVNTAQQQSTGWADTLVLVQGK